MIPRETTHTECDETAERDIDNCYEVSRRLVNICLITIICVYFLEQEIKHIQNYGGHWMDQSGSHKKKEVLVVSFANTGTHPWTMVVMHFDAGLTVTTVEWSWWSIDMTSSTFAHSDLFAIYHGNELPRLHTFLLSLPILWFYQSDLDVVPFVLLQDSLP